MGTPIGCCASVQFHNHNPILAWWILSELASKNGIAQHMAGYGPQARSIFQTFFRFA